MLGLSALTWFVIIVAGYALLLLILPREYMWIPFVAVVVAMMVLAYHIVPDETDDLYRYYGMLDIMREQGRAGLDYILERNWYDWQTFVTMRYYFYFLSFFPNNRYVAAVTMFIVCALMFLVMYKAAQRYQVSKGYVLLGTLFFLSTYWFYDAASGIRNGLAFAVVIACAYYHLVEKRNIILCFFGYVAACLLHSSPILPVTILLITLLTMKIGSKFVNIVMVLGLGIGGALIQTLSERTDNAFVSAIAEKSADFSTAVSLNMQTNYLVNIATLVIVLLVIWYFSVYFVRDKETDPIYRFYRYCSITAFFMIGCLFSSLIFLRFARWILPIMGAVLFMVGMQKQADFVKKQPPTFIYTGEKKMVLRVRTQGVMLLVYFAYICVHFWYACVGSSLIWMHF
jgi:hypothetical protein